MKTKLNPLELGDLDNIMSWVNDEEVIGRFNGFNDNITREQEQNYLEKMIASETDKLYSISTEDGVYLGQAGVHEIEANNDGRLALIIGNKEYWNKGCGQSAMEGLLDKAFNELKLERTWLVVLEQNKKARHIYEKIGFQQEEILKDYYQLGDQKLNMIKMSLHREEYARGEPTWNE